MALNGALQGVVVSASSPQWVCHDGTKDAFTTHGVRMWSPSRKEWAEVSVQGGLFTPTRSPEVYAGRAAPVPMEGRSNELESGCILDLGGVLLLYQGPLYDSGDVSAACPPWRVTDNITLRIVQCMNSLRPQCPVLMDSIHFTSSPPAKQRAQHLWEQQRGCFDRPLRSKHPAAAGRTHIERGAEGCQQDHIPYVFAACGHVHGYSKELVGR